MDNAIVFHNTVLEKEIRKKLCIPEGLVTVGDIQKVTEMDCSFAELDENDIEILKLCSNLSTLYWEIGNVDLSFLRAFRKLKELNLQYYNRDCILDFDVFSECNDLECLHVSGWVYQDMNFINTKSLIKLKKLKEISLIDFDSVDLSFLEFMPWVENVDCGFGRKVTGVESVRKLDNPNHLQLTDLDLEDLGFLEALPDDTELSLCGLTIKDSFDINKLIRFKMRDITDITINGEFYSDI